MQNCHRAFRAGDDERSTDGMFKDETSLMGGQSQIGLNLTALRLDRERAAHALDGHACSCWGAQVPKPVVVSRSAQGFGITPTPLEREESVHPHRCLQPPPPWIFSNSTIHPSPRPRFLTAAAYQI